MVRRGRHDTCRRDHDLSRCSHTRHRRLTLGQRLLVAQLLVLIASVVTIVVTAAVIGPPTFHAHMAMAHNRDQASMVEHAEMGFRQVGFFALILGGGIATVGAVVVNLVILRRVHVSLLALAAAARRLAAGDHGVPVLGRHTGSEIDSLASSLTDMSDRLAATERARRRMLTDLSHEMRTPVMAVDMSLEGLEDGVIDAGPDTIGPMRRHMARLTRLVGDMRDVSAAREGRFHLNRCRCDIDALIDDVVLTVTNLYRREGVSLDVVHGASTAEVWADRDRLAQILLNLLTNAVRHTPDGGSVTITRGAAGSEVLVTVADTGEGIPAEHLPRIFERYFSGRPDQQESRDVVGVGLTISAALAQAHGGSLTAHSDGPGRGAVFVLSLPTTGEGASRP